VGGDEWQQLSDGLDSAVETRLLQRVQETHAQLRAAHEVLARHCAAMAETSASVQRLHYGLARSLGVAAASHQPLFATSPVGYLALLAEEVAGMFQHELALKAAVVDDLPLCSNGDTARIYAASWSLQPYIGSFRRLPCPARRPCLPASLGSLTDPTALAPLSADIARLDEIRRSIKAEVDACAAA